MDHAINALKEYYVAEFNDFIDEVKSGDFKTLNECPNYGAVKALEEAIHRLEQFYYGKPVTMTVEQKMEVIGVRDVMNIQISFMRTITGWYNVLIVDDCFNVAPDVFERITGIGKDATLGCTELNCQQVAELKASSRYMKKGGCIQWVSA